MNIGIVTAWNETGSGYVSQAYLQALRRMEHNVFVFAIGQISKKNLITTERWGGDYVTWERNRHGYISRLEFFAWLEKRNIEMILYNEPRNTTFRLIDYCRSRGYIQTVYVDYYTEQSLPLFHRFDLLICNTRRHFSVFKKSGKAVYVPWGTDPNLFAPQERAGIDLKNRPIVLFHSSGLNSWDRKGTDLLLRAFHKVTGNVKLVIHTQTPLANLRDLSPEQVDSSKNLLKIIDEDSRIEVVTGTVTAPGLYHLGDVYLYPSRLDGIGLSLPEALSCGLAAIVTDEPPMSEFVTDEYENGLRVQVAKTYKRWDNYYWPMCDCDINSLAEKIQYYVDHPDILMRHKEGARRSVLEHFCWMDNSRSLQKALAGLHRDAAPKKLCAVDKAKLLFCDLGYWLRLAPCEAVKTIFKFVFRFLHINVRRH